MIVLIKVGQITDWISFANGSKSFWKNLEPRSDKIDSIIPKNGAIKNCRKIYARGDGGRKWKEFLENDLTRIRHGSTVEQCHERNQIGTKTEIAEWVERNESWRKRNWCRFSRKRGTFCRKWRPVSRGKRFKTTTVLMMTKRCTLSEANERVAALLRRIKGGHNRSVGCWKAAPNNFVPPLLSPPPSLSLWVEWTERASRRRGQMQRSDCNTAACISANFPISRCDCLPKKYRRSFY